MATDDDDTPIDLTLHKNAKFDQIVSDATASVAQLKKMQASIAEYHQIAAKIKYAKYKAYVNAGFSAAQALDLCKDPDII